MPPVGMRGSHSPKRGANAAVNQMQAGCPRVRLPRCSVGVASGSPADTGGDREADAPGDRSETQPSPPVVGAGHPGHLRRCRRHRASRGCGAAGAASRCRVAHLGSGSTRVARRRMRRRRAGWHGRRAGRQDRRKDRCGVRPRPRRNPSGRCSGGGVRSVGEPAASSCESDRESRRRGRSDIARGPRRHGPDHSPQRRRSPGDHALGRLAVVGNGRRLHPEAGG